MPARLKQRCQPRRRLLRLGLAALAGLLAVAALIVVYAVAVEPHWVAVRTIRLAARPVVRLVHITDLHYKGDRAYLERIVRRLYVNPGLGTFYAPIRLGCRPEVTLIEL